MKRIIVLLGLVLALAAGSVYAAGSADAFRPGFGPGAMGAGCAYGQMGGHHGGYGPHMTLAGWHMTDGHMAGVGYGPHGPMGGSAGAFGMGPGAMHE